ncbi:MAG: 1,4-alpha-glucan branching protein GlgB [Clostridia bacterium]|nr:1,4-alpha-glucan branching protein GlgB [Clostridia bacterium]
MKKKQDAAIKSFHEGTNERSYDLLGLHRSASGFVFRVWAPHAEQVYVVGDFNEWTTRDPLFRISDGGVWEAELPLGRVKPGQNYKYQIVSKGAKYYKSDPFGTCMETVPGTATVVEDTERYAWRDDGWLEYRKQTVSKPHGKPLNIYQVHLGSWKKHEDGSSYSYCEMASELAPYVKQMGYTHIELLPVMEQGGGNPWETRISSYFAPASRYGTPKDFMRFIDSMHEAGVGVILDWVPAYFSKDEHGLCEFDGVALYEYESPERMEYGGGEHARRFDVSRSEVVSFLISNAMFWIERYHADGICVRSVSSVIYLDYGKQEGEWTPNIYGDNRCLEAIRFFRQLNRSVKENYPDVLMIAEESTSWQGVTNLSGYSGLGFDLKWNVGWTRDALCYCGMDPIYRKYHHEKMTFSMIHAFAEKYVLPLSYSDGMCETSGIQNQIFGDYWQKFATHRALIGFLMTHPGKKLSFMGNEIGQFRGWDPLEQVEWNLLDYVSHARFQHYVSELNHLYLETPAFWEADDSWDGFQWIDPDNREQSILSYRRLDVKGGEVIVVINFTPVVREDFLLGVPYAGVYEEILSSDEIRFGGSGVVNKKDIFTAGRSWNCLPYSLRLTLPPLGMTVLRCKRKRSLNST